MAGLRIVLAGWLSVAMTGAQSAPPRDLPHLERRGAATQLIVDGQPYLALAGEVRNSSVTSRNYMSGLWPKLSQLNIDVVLAAIPWSSIEPLEHHFDFTIVDQLLQDANAHHKRLILLWFASWKNGESHYPPSWVKLDRQRFPRALTRYGEVETLSTLNQANVEADASAFAAMMRHLRIVDTKRTVLMVQVENEVGLLGDSRDRSAAANASYAAPVPAELVTYLLSHKEELQPRLRALWAATGFRTTGSWSDVFGSSPAAEEAFQAWCYAFYINRVAAAGKREYPLPMFVNAWLNGPDAPPGEYPSGGPQSHNLDLWHAAAPNIDIFGPDIYSADITDIAAQFFSPGQPFFVPETFSGAVGAANAYVAIGQYHAIGLSPFAVPFGIDGKDIPATNAMGRAYGVLRQLAPQILEQQSRGNTGGIIINSKKPDQTIMLGGYGLSASLPKDRMNGESPAQGYAIVLNTAPDEFIIAGSDIQIGFTDSTGNQRVGLETVEEGTFVKGAWKRGRILNGDETSLSFQISAQIAAHKPADGLRFTGPVSIQRVELYKYP